MTTTEIQDHLQRMADLRFDFASLWHRSIKPRYVHLDAVEQAAAMIVEWNLFRSTKTSHENNHRTV